MKNILEVSTIENKSDMDNIQILNVDNWQWDSKISPKTTAKIAYLKDVGLYVKMCCYETNPKREKTKMYERVCEDSALEAFFALADHPLKDGEIFEVSNDGLYLNFEVNANGLLYARYGHGRTDRHFITEEDYEKCEVCAKIHEDRWEMEFIFTLDLIEKLTGVNKLYSGYEFACNFYKYIDDDEKIHYGSYKKIDRDAPNFHLPTEFARAVIK